MRYIVLSLSSIIAVLVLAAPTNVNASGPMQPTPEDPANTDGTAIYAQHCAACHGVSGRGDGMIAVNANLNASDFTDPANRESMTLDEWQTVIRNGRLDQAMPAYGSILSPAQVQAVALYTYNLSMPEANQDVNVPITETTGSIAGTITNGTTDMPYDETITAELYVLDEDFQEVSTQTTDTSDGVFRFDDVILRPDRRYVVTATYDGTTFTSDLINGTTDDPTLELPVTIYEFTDDPDVIEIDLLVLRISPYGDGLLFEQMTNFRNTSPRAYRLTDAQTTSISLTLPGDALILNQAELMSRFIPIESEDALTLQDTLPVVPDVNHSVYVVYTLPYAEDSPVDFELPLTFDMTSAVEVMLQPDQFRVTSEQLQDAGRQTFSSGTYDQYLADPLTAGSTLRFRLERTAQIQPPERQASTDDRSTLARILLIGGGSLLVQE